MEPIQIHVSVELNFSQDVKNFLASVVSNHAATSAPKAPEASAPKAPEASAPKAPETSAPKAPETSAPKAPETSAPKAPEASAPSITIEQVRQALAAKVNGHREEIKEKLNSLGAPSVTKLDPAKYIEMYNFLIGLS